MIAHSLLWAGFWYKNLYRFLASRFLSAPDAILDCESTHAKWKWITDHCRNISFHGLNCSLKVMSYIQYFGSLPNSDTLAEYLPDARQLVRDQIEVVKAGGDVAPRMTVKAATAHRSKHKVPQINLKHF